MKNPFAICDLRFAIARRGFAFTEILFAVMVLGIGFIMIAAIFPVTIQQTQVTVEESLASTAGKSAVQYLQNAVGLNQLQVTGSTLQTATVEMIPSNLRPLISGGMILPSNPRIGWTALYRRVGTPAGAQPYAQVYVIVAQARGRPQFGREDFFHYPEMKQGGKDHANLGPKPVRVRVKQLAGNAQPYSLQFDTSQGFPGAAGEGAFVIIKDDKISGGLKGQCNGRIFQLGSYDDALGAWNLTPGYEPAVDDPILRASGGLTDADAWILGRGFFWDGSSGAGRYQAEFSGPPMDIGIYVGFIKLN